MARKPAAATGASIPGRQPLKRVLITHYKVFTSIGRLIEGQREALPADEADGLIAKGHARPCP